jgi:hypothetical protein
LLIISNEVRICAGMVTVAAPWQARELAAIRSILPKPQELEDVLKAKQAAEQKMPAGSAAAPRLGPAEAAVEALGGVELLQAKMRAMEFRCGGLGTGKRGVYLTGWSAGCFDGCECRRA